MSILTNILGSLAQPVLDYLTERRKDASVEKLRKMELDDAMQARKVDLIKQGLVSDATWEIEQIRNSGWKDEYVLLVISIPYIGCYLPFAAPYVLAGFKIIEQTPEWYRWLVMLIFTAIYGIRIWRRQQYDTESPRDQ